MSLHIASFSTTALESILLSYTQSLLKKTEQGMRVRFNVLYILALKFMILWANWLGGITNYVYKPVISVRFNVLDLLARNLLQGGKEWQNGILRVMFLTPHLIDPQHHLFQGGYSSLTTMVQDIIHGKNP